MKPCYTNTDYNAKIKVRGVYMSVADFIALDVENCPICGTDELDFWDLPQHMGNVECTAVYVCPNCRRKYEWDGNGPEKGHGRSFGMALRDAKKNWNAWAKSMRKTIQDKQKRRKGND